MENLLIPVDMYKILGRTTSLTGTVSIFGRRHYTYPRNMHVSTKTDVRQSETK